MDLERNAPPTLPPEAVIFTSQLLYRSSRPSNPLEENKAFHELALCLVSNPDRFLDRLVEVALKLCDGDTVGISVETKDAARPKNRCRPFFCQDLVPAFLPVAGLTVVTLSGLWVRINRIEEGYNRWNVSTLYGYATSP